MRRITEIISPNENTLNNFIQETDLKFEEIYFRMNFSPKEKYRNFLIYLHKILEKYLMANESASVNFLHLHIPFINKSFREVLLEYITIKFFVDGFDSDIANNSFIEGEIVKVNRILANTHLPDNASASKGNKEYRQWKENREKLRRKLNFFEFVKGKSLQTQTILNVFNNDAELLDIRCESEWYVTKLEALVHLERKSYVLLNTELSKEKLTSSLEEAELLSGIKHILLFDTEGRRAFQGFNKTNLEELREFGIPIENLLMISFEARTFRLRNTIKRLQQLYSNYYLQPLNYTFDRSYIFSDPEIDLLVNDKISRSHYWEWFGDENEAWEDYLDIVKDYKLDKLRSIPFLNILSFAVNKKVASIILDSIFGNNSHFNILDAETRILITDLDKQEAEYLKNSIVSILDFVINQWNSLRKRIKEICDTNRPAILIPHQVYKSPMILSEFKSFLKGSKYKIYTWNDMKELNIKEGIVLILSYRDTGSFPFNIYPNIIENRLSQNLVIYGLFLRCFFQQRFNNIAHAYLSTYNKLLSNKVRNISFQWGEVTAEINAIRKYDIEGILDADDYAYGIGSSSESIRLEYEDKSHISLYPSKLLIARKNDSSSYEVIRADDLLDESDWAEYKVQPLEEVYEYLNLFEITQEEEKELLIIKKEFGLGDDRQELALWKVELFKKLTEFGDDKFLLYEQIRSITGNDGKFIQFGYFCDYWLKKDSALLIPRKTKHFRQICDYLGLPVLTID